MEAVKQLFDGFERLNVLVIGDLMLDRYIYGATDRISPEAPVPVVDLQRQEARLGGAANVTLNLQALGATPYLCSVAGQDAMGEKLLAEMQARALYNHGVLSSADRCTTVKTRVIAGTQHLLRIDEEVRDNLSDKDTADLLERVRHLLDTKSIDVILFQDYDKGVLYSKLIKTVMLEALTREIPTIVDPKYNNFFEYRRISLFKPNLREVSQALGREVQPELDDLREAARAIRDQLGQKYTLITLSNKGLFIEDGKTAQIIPTNPRSIADVCGAGDTVVSVAALCLGMDTTMAVMGRLSNLAGGQVCERVGVAVVDRQQLQQEYLQLTTNPESI